MSSSSANQLGDQLRQAQVALCNVAHALSRSDGQHQFYPLARVQSATAASTVGRELVPWVIAALVTRADFEAFYALRQVPGTYLQLRTQLSAPQPRIANADASEVEFSEQLWSVLDWLDLAGNLEDLDWFTPGS